MRNAKIKLQTQLIKLQRGASMLEAMIAIFILGFGLLGLSATQSRNIMMNQSVFYRSIAVDLGNDLGDRIRALRTPYMVSTDATTKPAKPPDFSKCSYTTSLTCTNQDADRNAYQTLVNAEMLEWNNVLRAQLPNGSFVLTPTPSSSTDYFRYVLTITWLDNRKDNSNTSYSVVIE